MLFSDRDFGADDYEALLALDEGIDNRKGVLPAILLKCFLRSAKCSAARAAT